MKKRNVYIDNILINLADGQYVDVDTDSRKTLIMRQTKHKRTARASSQVCACERGESKSEFSTNCNMNTQTHEHTHLPIRPQRWGYIYAADGLPNKNMICT